MYFCTRVYIYAIYAHLYICTNVYVHMCMCTCTWKARGYLVVKATYKTTKHLSSRDLTMVPFLFCFLRD